MNALQVRSLFSIFTFTLIFSTFSTLLSCTSDDQKPVYPSKSTATNPMLSLTGPQSHSLNGPFEHGSITITQTSRDDWQEIFLARNYINPVVILSPVSKNDGEPAITRIKEIQSGSFKLQVSEWAYQDGIHASEEIHFLVIEAGSHVVNGMEFEAGFVEGATHRFKNISLVSPRSEAPLILTQLSSVNESDPATVRIRRVTGENFQLKLKEEENSPNRKHIGEKVGYLAITYMSGGQESYFWEAGFESSGTSITAQFPLSQNRVFAAMQTHSGGDTAALRYDGSAEYQSVIFLEEETSKDTETNHVAETIGFFYISSFDGVLSEVSSVESELLNDARVRVSWERNVDLVHGNPNGYRVAYSNLRLPNSACESGVEPLPGEDFGLIDINSYPRQAEYSIGIDLQNPNQVYNFRVCQNFGFYSEGVLTEIELRFEAENLEVNSNPVNNHSISWDSPHLGHERSDDGYRLIVYSGNSTPEYCDVVPGDANVRIDVSISSNYEKRYVYEELQYLGYHELYAVRVCSLWGGGISKGVDWSGLIGEHPENIKAKSLPNGSINISWKSTNDSSQEYVVGALGENAPSCTDGVSSDWKKTPSGMTSTLREVEFDVTQLGEKYSFRVCSQYGPNFAGESLSLINFPLAHSLKGERLTSDRLKISYIDNQSIHPMTYELLIINGSFKKLRCSDPIETYQVAASEMIYNSEFYTYENIFDQLNYGDHTALLCPRGPFNMTEGLAAVVIPEFSRPNNFAGYASSPTTVELSWTNPVNPAPSRLVGIEGPNPPLCEADPGAVPYAYAINERLNFDQVNVTVSNLGREREYSFSICDEYSPFASLATTRIWTHSSIEDIEIIQPSVDSTTLRFESTFDPTMQPSFWVALYRDSSSEYCDEFGAISRQMIYRDPYQSSFYEVGFTGLEQSANYEIRICAESYETSDRGTAVSFSTVPTISEASLKAIDVRKFELTWSQPQDVHEVKIFGYKGTVAPDSCEFEYSYPNIYQTQVQTYQESRVEIDVPYGAEDFTYVMCPIVYGDLQPSPIVLTGRPFPSAREFSVVATSVTSLQAHWLQALESQPHPTELVVSQFPISEKCGEVPGPGVVHSMTYNEYQPSFDISVANLPYEEEVFVRLCSLSGGWDSGQYTSVILRPEVLSLQSTTPTPSSIKLEWTKVDPNIEIVILKSPQPIDECTESAVYPEEIFYSAPYDSSKIFDSLQRNQMYYFRVCSRYSEMSHGVAHKVPLVGWANGAAIENQGSNNRIYWTSPVNFDSRMFHVVLFDKPIDQLPDLTCNDPQNMPVWRETVYPLIPESDQFEAFAPNIPGSTIQICDYDDNFSGGVVLSVP